MLQAIVRKGKVVAEETPEPTIENGYILIKVVNSCISAGTEMTGVKASGKSLLKRIEESPSQLNKAIQLLKTKGFDSLINKVDQLQAGGKITGYSVSGIIMEIGAGVSGFNAGDRVAAAGAGFANHAEFVKVPFNLVTKIPDDVSFADASTTTIGSIAIQGVRRADLKFGEFAVVFGAGILGLITLQVLHSTGIRVAVIDIDPVRILKAKELGAELAINSSDTEPIKIIDSWTNGFGADAVIFTAATTSSGPLSDSFKMCKRKGQVVLVGVSGMEIQRSDIYSKELDFKMSTSYGPGRYDNNYEMKGCDYPYAYVRWTENRNMQEYLRLLQNKNINIASLVDRVYSINDVEEAYKALNIKESKPLVIILDYGQTVAEEPSYTVILKNKNSNNTKGKKLINIALVGAGNFAVGTHIPVIKKLSDKFNLYCVLNKSGHKAKFVAEQYGASYATTDFNKILDDPNVDLVLITTRHDSHADYVVKSLKAGKHVFVEKPLAVNIEQLNGIAETLKEMPQEKLLFTGFNRRFSPFIREIKNHTDNRINPLFINYRMNAGYIPLDHWVHESGGRMVGELCHVIDLMLYLTGSTVETIYSEALVPTTGKFSCNDNKVISLRFKDGSLANITYFAVGNKSFPKEYMDIHYDENTIVMDNYQRLEGYGIKLKNIVAKTPSKGIMEEYLAVFKAITSDTLSYPISINELFHTTEITFKV
jgi:predicted dehydrogenase/threonine dehydrogenase-like Zn-dependent dehydrogenase